MKLILVLLISLYRVDGELTPDVAGGVVELHNKYRRLVGKGKVANMREITWDPDLALEAELMTSCDTDLLPWQPLEYNMAGLPVRAASVGYGRRNSSVLSIIRRWFKEATSYDKKFNTCLFGRVCQRYMQIVSAPTMAVGCAVKPNCRRKNVGLTSFSYKLLVCVYKPGLDLSSPLFAEGATCTQCEEPTPFCHQGLCTSCKNKHREKCECRKTCSAPSVGYGVLNKDTCSCECIYGSGPNCDKPCRNPEQYVDYDICYDVTPEVCSDPDEEVARMLMEFCPEQCACKPEPPLFKMLGLD